MMYKSGSGQRGCFGLKPARCALILFTAAAAGCSADVTRFDSASFALNDPPETTASVDTETAQTDYNNPVTRSQRPGPYGAGLSSRDDVEAAPLADATPVQPPPAMAPAPMAEAVAEAPRDRQLYRPARQQVAMAPPPAASVTPPSRGEAIEVQPGDTLYGLARRHQVSLAELMSVNGLTAPNIWPGQKLYLPSGEGARVAAAAHAIAPLAPSAPSMTAPAAPAEPPPAVPVDRSANYTGSYTVKPGDSLYAIARAHKVPFTELQQVNGISNPLKVRPGVVLKVPQSGTQTAALESPMTTAAVQAPSPMPNTSAPATASEALNLPSTSATPTILNAAKPADTVAPVPAPSAGAAPKSDKVALATPPPETAVAETKLRWPAQGRIIAGFGGRPDGTHNDGINLAVPQGTEVHAAESGVVAYAGSELKGYGNLVLVRHDNGWVTAYAHNEELLVKRGDKVTRGQIIAKAGATGTVDQPQVHFELRQGSKPVDPVPFMEKI